MSEVVSTVAVLVGATFFAISAIGLGRLPDFFCRIHAVSKASTVGLCSLLVGYLFAVKDPSIFKGILILVAIITSIPVATHFLGRSARRHGVQSKLPMEFDEARPDRDDMV